MASTNPFINLDSADSQRFSTPKYPSDSPQQLLASDEIVFITDEDLLRREEEVASVLYQVKEVNGLFKDLATLIYGQSDTVGTIASNISESNSNAKKALNSITVSLKNMHSKLTFKEAEQSQNESRSCLCCSGIICSVVFGLLVIGAIVYIVLLTHWKID